MSNRASPADDIKCHSTYVRSKARVSGFPRRSRVLQPSTAWGFAPYLHNKELDTSLNIRRSVVFEIFPSFWFDNPGSTCLVGRMSIGPALLLLMSGEWLSFPNILRITHRLSDILRHVSRKGLQGKRYLQQDAYCVERKKIIKIHTRLMLLIRRHHGPRPGEKKACKTSVWKGVVDRYLRKRKPNCLSSSSSSSNSWCRKHLLL